VEGKGKKRIDNGESKLKVKINANKGGRRQQQKTGRRVRED
jgi:hypothetical protein